MNYVLSILVLGADLVYYIIHNNELITDIYFYSKIFYQYINYVIYYDF